MVNMTGLLAQLSLLAGEAAGAAGEHAGGHGISDFVLPTWLWTWILFGIVFFILAKFAWKPLREQLEARENRIRETVEKADQVKTEAEALLDKHREMMDRAKADAQEIINEGREAGERVREEAAEAGKVEAEEIITRARKEIDLEVKKAIDELRRETVDLSLLAASRILERSLEDDDHRKLANQVVDEIGNAEREA
jgi:F-type H+-transporting ATPase subunit b